MTILDAQIADINRLSNDADGSYHLLAQHFGLSDNIYWIFYILYDNKDAVTQTDLSRKWSFSKKTVNSSIASMVKNGWISLELLPGSRKLKAIRLTKDGAALCQQSIGLTRAIEQRAYQQLAPADLQRFLELFREINRNFQTAVGDLLAADDTMEHIK